jgi:ferredoxin
MKVTIDRNLCTAALNACEHCFSVFVENPMGVDRYCIVERVEDGSEDMVLTLRSEDFERTLVLDEQKRRLVATEGWSSLVDFIPAFYKE